MRGESGNPDINVIIGRLKRKNIYELRQIARECGVACPTALKRDKLLEEIEKIALAKTEPTSPATRGAPPKSQEYDRALVAEIEQCRAYSIAGEIVPRKDMTLKVASSECDDVESMEVKGVLYKTGDRYALSQSLGVFSRSKDVFVDESIVARYDLRIGDEVEGVAQYKKELTAGLAAVRSVNGGLATLSRNKFAEIRAVYPGENTFREVFKDFRIPFIFNDNCAQINCINLFSPLIYGGRGIICGEPRSGATTLIYTVARECSLRFTALKTVVLLSGARPEEISEFKDLNFLKVFSTPFDCAEKEKEEVASLALEHCKRLAESGKKVLFLIDSLNKLDRTYAALSRPDGKISGGAEKFLSAARALENGGCITVLGAVSLADENLCGRAAEICNIRINLCAGEGEQFPCIDCKTSYTARSERLLPPLELKAKAAAQKLPNPRILRLAEQSDYRHFVENLINDG